MEAGVMRDAIWDLKRIISLLETELGVKQAFAITIKLTEAIQELDKLAEERHLAEGGC